MVEKDPLRSVTIRDLARNAAAIFDELSAEGRPLVVTRGGIPVASLQPLDVQPWRPLPQANPLEAAEVDPVDLETLTLSELQRDIILWLAAPASPDDVAFGTKTATKDVLTARCGGVTTTALRISAPVPRSRATLRQANRG
jgi:antitoxin (DNA-binding transcriptional repressor) of toxin-antitoxin stability system